jgi:hypothetical protein
MAACQMRAVRADRTGPRSCTSPLPRFSIAWHFSRLPFSAWFTRVGMGAPVVCAPQPDGPSRGQGRKCGGSAAVSTSDVPSLRPVTPPHRQPVSQPQAMLSLAPLLRRCVWRDSCNQFAASSRPPAGRCPTTLDSTRQTLVTAANI